jgi:hypothetical protein
MKSGGKININHERGHIACESIEVRKGLTIQSMPANSCIVQLGARVGADPAVVNWPVAISVPQPIHVGLAPATYQLIVLVAGDIQPQYSINVSELPVESLGANSPQVAVIGSLTKTEASSDNATCAVLTGTVTSASSPTMWYYWSESAAIVKILSVSITAQ